ncbi:glutamate--tRNA ligase [Eubacteriales bacterium OttesenSCG-928-G02]|nr:glutamate--tRNA ligase [Eubacteriales bacterium OttesenSCG-928-G02]
MDYKALADLLYPNVPDNAADKYEEIYPPRKLPEAAKVTRIAPSPTGFVHFGTLYPLLITERLARQSGGVMYLRIEDTDGKREIKGAINDLIDVLSYFGFNFDESITAGGEYGPYKQTERKDIYSAYAKKLISEGKAYPCFCTAEELSEIRSIQEQNKKTTGYYGEYIKCRHLSLDEIKSKLDAGIPYVIRFKSDGKEENKIKFTDLIKGEIELCENFIDHVIIKSDGIPPYHFAHAVDDHLMRTTHVVRGEEWLPSLPLHLQLFDALGFKRLKYIHHSQLMKKENDSIKKLSKRDHGASISDYIEDGYPPLAVVEYIMTLLNSNFEDWRRANPDTSYKNFEFTIKKISPSGSVFDIVKLNDVSKNVIATFTAEEVYEQVCKWAEKFDADLFSKLTADPAYAKKIFAIGRGTPKARKDIAVWAEVKEYLSFFYDEYFRYIDKIPEQYKTEDIKTALNSFLETLDINDNMDEWFNKVKEICPKINYCPNTKEYKQNPEQYGGHIGDVSMFIRIALTGRTNAPDLYAVIQILGKDTVEKRINNFINKL